MDEFCYHSYEKGKYKMIINVGVPCQYVVHSSLIRDDFTILN